MRRAKKQVLNMLYHIFIKEYRKLTQEGRSRVFLLVLLLA